MAQRRKPTLTPEEARKFHYEALVIDAQQPPATSGFLFTERMRAALNEYIKRDGPKARDEIAPLMEEMAVQEIKTSPEARDQYLDLWRRSGVTVASGTYAGTEPPSRSFELATKRLAQAHAVVDALDGELILVRRAADIERAHWTKKHGLILDSQNATPFGGDPGSIGQRALRSGGKRISALGES